MNDGKILDLKDNMRDDECPDSSILRRQICCPMTIRCSALIVPRQSVFELSRRRCVGSVSVCRAGRVHADFVQSTLRL